MLQTFIEEFSLEDKWTKLLVADGILESLGYNKHTPTIDTLITSCSTELKLDELCVFIEKVLNVALCEVLAEMKILIKVGVELSILNVLVEGVISFLDGITKEELQDLSGNDIIETIIDKFNLNPSIFNDLIYVGDFTGMVGSSDQSDELPTEDSPTIKKTNTLLWVSENKPTAITKYLEEGGQPGFAFEVYETIVTSYYFENDPVPAELAKDIYAMYLLSGTLKDYNPEWLDVFLNNTFDVDVFFIGKVESALSDLMGGQSASI